MTMPLVSIVVPIWNREAFVDIFYESVRNQTFTDWELLVVDDGSEDRGPLRVAALSRADARVKLFRHPGGAHRGMCASRNFGAAQARGELLAFLDSDNTWSAEKLELQIEALRRETVPMVYAPQKLEIEQGVDGDLFRGTQERVTPGLHYPPDIVPGYLSGEESHPQPSQILMEREAFWQTPGFMEELFPHEYGEDTAFACVLGALFPIYAMPEPLGIHLLHRESCTMQAIQRDTLNAQMSRVLVWLAGWFAGRGLSSLRRLCQAPHLLR